MLLDIPSTDFDLWLNSSRAAGVISRRDFALFARKQRNVIVLPHHRQNFLASLTLVELQSHEKCKALAGIFHSDMRHCILAVSTVLSTARDVQLYLWELSQRVVVRVRCGRSRVPVRLRPAECLRLR